MSPPLSEVQRLFGAVLALILAGSGGSNQRGGSLDLERQDASGCTLMHYVCGLRNLPALKLLLDSTVDPRIRDSQKLTAADWANRYGWTEGEALIARHLGEPVPSAPNAAAAIALPADAAAIAAAPIGAPATSAVETAEPAGAATPNAPLSCAGISAVSIPASAVSPGTAAAASALLSGAAMAPPAPVPPSDLA